MYGNPIQDRTIQINGQRMNNLINGINWIEKVD